MRSGISSDMLAQLNALQSKPGHLFEAHFDDELVRMTDFYTNIVWNGNTYTQGGHALSYDGVQENVQMTAALARIVVSAVDQTWVARILAKDYINRRLVIYKATLDAAWNVVVDPAVVFDGLMKKPQILDDPDAADCKLMISASHDASDVNNAAGRRTNDQSQQVYFPGDRIFRYASQSDRSILWGGGVAP